MKRSLFGSLSAIAAISAAGAMALPVKPRERGPDDDLNRFEGSRQRKRYLQRQARKANRKKRQ